MFRECKKPVTSYGQILVDIDKVPTKSKILMILRKDSLCFIELLRGKYEFQDINYIQILIDKCSIDEKALLHKRPSFDELWVSLWSLSELDTTTLKFKRDYLRGKEKYEGLLKGYIHSKSGKQISLSILINQSKTNYPTSEWEFPKGRRNNLETNRECAIREFHEETGYNRDDYRVIENIKPLEEEYMGENGVKYKHIYYVGYLINKLKSLKVDPMNIHQVSEIKDIQWVTQSESLNKLRDYHRTRYNVIHKVFTFLTKLDDDFFIIE